MCNHNYSFGEVLVLTAGTNGTAICQNCACDHISFIDGAKIIFRGHNDGMAMFDLVKPFNCPSCGQFTGGYAEYCDGLPINSLLFAELEGGNT